MPASGRSAVLGFGRQAAEGTPLATPRFEIAMGGGYVGPERTVDTLPFTTDTQDRVGEFVSRVAGSIDCSVPVLPSSVGALFQAVLGARQTVGSLHTFTPADALAWFTFFYAQPGGNFITLEDAKLSRAQLNFQPGQPLTMDLSGGGKDVRRAGTKWATASLVEPVDPFFTYIGAEMLLDVDATPAATRVRNIAGGNIAIDRNIERIQTDEVGDTYLVEQGREISVTLDDTVFEDNDVINTVFFGSPTGTELSATTVYGSIDFGFVLNDGTPRATTELRVRCPRVNFSVDALPAADPGGGAVRYSVVGNVSKPATGASIEVVLRNAETGTNY